MRIDRDMDQLAKDQIRLIVELCQARRQPMFNPEIFEQKKQEQILALTNLNDELRTLLNPERAEQQVQPRQVVIEIENPGQNRRFTRSMRK